MNKLLALILSTGITLTSTLTAYFHPKSGCWDVEADYLYLLTSVDDTYYVIASPYSTLDPVGTRRDNDFGFQSGFRVGGVYALCNCGGELRADYSRIRSTTEDHISGDFLWATVGSANFVNDFLDYSGTASSHNDLLYQRVDGFYSVQLLNCCRTGVYCHTGLEYAYIRITENLKYVRNERPLGAPITGSVFQRSRAWGVGPQLGFEIDYAFCNSPCWGKFSVVGLGTGSLLVSNTNIKSSNTTDIVGGLDIRDKTTWRTIPGFHARVGLQYEACFSCFDAGLEIGYEINSYVRAINWQAFPSGTSNSLCYTAYKNFDAHGLYVSLGLAF